MTARTKHQNGNGRPVWADVSLSALAHNLHAIRDFVNPKSEKRPTPRKVLCIVKGNGRSRRPASGQSSRKGRLGLVWRHWCQRRRKTSPGWCARSEERRVGKEGRSRG